MRRHTASFYIILFTLIGVCVAVLYGCDEIPPSADQKERAKTEQLTAEASREVGMPGITKFTEKKIVARLYELRDQTDLHTYTYTMDISSPVKLNSVGEYQLEK